MPPKQFRTHRISRVFLTPAAFSTGELGQSRCPILPCTCTSSCAPAAASPSSTPIAVGWLALSKLHLAAREAANPLHCCRKASQRHKTHRNLSFPTETPIEVKAGRSDSIPASGQPPPPGRGQSRPAPVCNALAWQRRGRPELSLRQSRAVLGARGCPRQPKRASVGAERGDVRFARCLRRQDPKSTYQPGLLCVSWYVDLESRVTHRVVVRSCDLQPRWCQHNAIEKVARSRTVH